jgi:hypothetical protein
MKKKIELKEIGWAIIFYGGMVGVFLLVGWKIFLGVFIFNLLVDVNKAIGGDEG